MKDLPWFSLYASDFANSRRVRTMTPAQVGVYILFLCHEWDAGPLPDDPATLSRLANDATTEDIEAVLKRCFNKLPNDTSGWVNDRLENERDEAVALRERRVNSGRLGGERSSKSRSTNKMEAPLKRALSDAQASLNDRSSNHSHSHSTDKEKKPSVSKRKKPRTDLPADWEPTEAHWEKAERYGLDLDEEAEKWENYHGARGNQFCDWGKAFHTWLDKADEIHGGNSKPVTPPPKKYHITPEEAYALYGYPEGHPKHEPPVQNA